MNFRKRILWVVSLISAWAMLTATPAIAGSVTRTAPYAWSQAQKNCTNQDTGGSCIVSALADRTTGTIQVSAEQKAKALTRQAGIATARGTVSGNFRPSKSDRTVRATVTLQIDSADAALVSDVKGDLARLIADATLEMSTTEEWLYHYGTTTIVDTDPVTEAPTSTSGSITVTVERTLQPGQILDGVTYLHLSVRGQGWLNFPSWASLVDRSATATGSVTVTSIEFRSF